MSKLIEGLERDAIVRMTIVHKEEEHEFVLKEDLYIETMAVLHEKGVEELISFLENHKDVTEIDLSINIK